VEVNDPQQKKILYNWEREDVEEGHLAMPMMIFVDDNKEIQLCEESNEAHLHTAYVHFFLRQLWKTLQTEEDHLQKRGTKWAETFTFLVCCYGSTYRVP
jgi:hypothetical protein